MLNKNLTNQEAKWLLEEYQPKMGYGVNSKNINMFNDALNLMKGTNNPCPGCSCQYLTIAKIAASLFEQYKSEIEIIANKTTRGRKKTNT